VEAEATPVLSAGLRLPSRWRRDARAHANGFLALTAAAAPDDGAEFLQGVDW
jgi:hypothetical protein